MTEEEIFHQALACGPEERAAYLEQACAGDPALRAAVEALLRANVGATGFLEPAAPAPVLTLPEQPLRDGPGTVIGPYKLLEQIGQGGFGVVFLAEQTQPVRRKVALKILKPGMDTRQVVARFEAERQALAIMDHPNIAKVFDGGATSFGRPYFVMELVKGVPITDFCDQHLLTPRQRLELFVPVCQAVQHAHQKGIIHRDLKPSNVLVSRHDTAPVVKVIDFGVAKALGQELTDKTLFTGLNQVIGTPLYMSPEQAGMSDLDIDTRSDIYSLGVLLYELLTGTTPFTRERFRQAAYDEIRRIIREEEPPRPSTRLSEAKDQLPSISAQRQTEPAKLTKLVRGDLDWIVMKCLEKDRARRYATANQLGEELQRYLVDEPVQAGPPSPGYRLKKFLRRNKGPALAAALVLLALIAGIIGTSIGLVQAERARAAEKKQRERAAAREQETRAANEGLAAEQKRAEQARRRAEESERAALANRDGLRRALYAMTMNEVQAAWNAGNVPRVQELLDEQRPWPGEDDLRGFEWHYWFRQCNSERRAVQVMIDPGPHDLVLSADGRLLAALGANDLSTAPPLAAPIKIYDTATGKWRTTLAAAAPVGGACAFRADGQRIACLAFAGPTAGPDLAIRVFDVATGKALLTLEGSEQRPPTERRAERAAFAFAGKRIAAVLPGKEPALRLWDAETGKILRSQPLGQPRGAVAFQPGGKQLAVSTAGALVVLQAVSGKERLRIQADLPQNLAFSPDGSCVAGWASTPGNAPALRGWDLVTGKERFALAVPGGDGARAIFSPDGLWLAAWHERGEVRVWQVSTGRLVLDLKTPALQAVAFSAKGRQLTVAETGGAVRWWDCTAPPAWARAKEGEWGVPVAFSYWIDEPRIAAIDPEKAGVVRIAGPDGKETQRLRLAGLPLWRELLADGESPTPAAFMWILNGFSADGRRLALVSQEPEQPKRPGPVKAIMQVWDLPGGTERFVVRFLAPRRPIWCWSLDGSRLALLDASGLRVLDGATGKDLMRAPALDLGMAPDEITDMALSADGQRVALRGSAAVLVWDAAAGVRLRVARQLPGEDLPGFDWHPLALSPDGKLLGFWEPGKVAGSRPAIHLWEVDTGAERVPLACNDRELLFSRDGKRLVTTGRSGVRLWDVTTGRGLLTLSNTAWFVRFSPDGRRLTGPNDHTDGFLQTWSAEPVAPAVQARAYVSLLSQRLPAKAEIIEALHADTRLDDAVRQAALVLADNLVDNPDRLAQLSLFVIFLPGRRAEDYRLALQRVQTAARLLSGKEPFVQVLLGLAQYRNGLYEQALASFDEARRLAQGRDGQEVAAWPLLGLAVTHFKLGHRAEAARLVEAVRKDLTDQLRRDFRLAFPDAEELLAAPSR